MPRLRELPLSSKDGAVAPDHLRCSPVRDESGHVVDLRVERVSPSYAALLATQSHVVEGADCVGRLVSAVCPSALLDGIHDATCAVADSGLPFTYTRPGQLDGSHPTRRIRVSGLADGWVLVESRVLSSQQALQEVFEQDGPRWRRAFRDAPLGIGIASYAGAVIEVNDTVCRLFGRPANDLVGRSFNDFAYPEDEHLRVDRDALLDTGRFEMTKRYVTGDGQVVWLRVVVTLVTEHGELRLLTFFEDIGDAVRSRAELEQAARRDPLTRLPNRLAFGEQLNEALRTGPAPALLYLDVDRFKVVNDSLGHDAGDRVLRLLADAVTDVVGERGTVSRLGGDELVVLVHEGAGAEQVAADLLDRVDGTTPVPGLGLPVGVSIGLARAEPDTDEDSLLRDADTALYDAKRAGGGRCVVFDTTLRERARTRLAVEVDLRRALADDELRVHYQPVWDRRGRLRAVEALVRWQHPDRGLLAPGAFLDVAEETGLVTDLGRTVLRVAAADLARWRRLAPTLRLSVNVAPAHLMSGTLLDDVAGALEPYGLDAGDLALEITESTLVHGHATTAALQQLRAQGCRVAVDDFGTGFSSLAYLRDFPVDVLKVDRSFVTATDDERGQTLLASTCGLGRSLGLAVVAEGVETEREREGALAAGADLLQGYLLGRPVPAEELERLLAQR